MDFNNDTSKGTQLIYLSGAGLDSFVWNDVRTKVILPGIVATHDRQDTTTLSSVTHDILGQIQNLKASQYIIIAHSLSGVVGLELARALGDKLCGFIAVSATIPSPGKSFTDTLPFPQNFLMPPLLKVVGTQPPVAAIRKSLCSDLNDEQAAAVISTFKPEPPILNITTAYRLSTH